MVLEHLIAKVDLLVVQLLKIDIMKVNSVSTSYNFHNERYVMYVTIMSDFRSKVVCNDLSKNLKEKLYLILLIVKYYKMMKYIFFLLQNHSQDP